MATVGRATAPRERAKVELDEHQRDAVLRYFRGRDRQQAKRIFEAVEEVRFENLEVFNGKDRPPTKVQLRRLRAVSNAARRLDAALAAVADAGFLTERDEYAAALLGSRDTVKWIGASAAAQAGKLIALPWRWRHNRLHARRMMQISIEGAVGVFRRFNSVSRGAAQREADFVVAALDGLPEAPTSSEWLRRSYLQSVMVGEVVPRVIGTSVA